MKNPRGTLADGAPSLPRLNVIGLGFKRPGCAVMAVWAWLVNLSVVLKRLLAVLVAVGSVFPVAAQQTSILLPIIVPGSEQVQRVPNGDFQQPGPPTPGGFPDPDGWTRSGTIYVAAGLNMIASDQGLVAQGEVLGQNAGYTRSLSLQPNTGYVLSGYLWNLGDGNGHVTTVVDLNDAPGEAQLILNWTDPGADQGYFVYAPFNTGTTGTELTLRCFYDGLFGPGTRQQYFPIAAQWDNLAITRADLFREPAVITQETKLPLPGLISGTEQVQLVANGDFQQPGQPIGGVFPNPTGWDRSGQMVVASGFHQVAANEGLLAQGLVSEPNSASGYSRFLGLQPGTEYVLSGYLWNLGDADHHVITVVDLNDAPGEAQLTLNFADANPDRGYFVYARFNTATTGTKVTLRCFHDGLQGRGATLNYFPAGAQWDNLAITPEADFSPPEPVIPPSISVHPLSQTVLAGTDVTFTVGAAGTAPLSYQWQFNGSPIPGATLSSHTVPQAKMADAGNYTVVVSNAAGSKTSDLAILKVNLPPVAVIVPSDATVCVGQDVSFQASGGVSYVWSGPGGFTANSAIVTRNNVTAIMAGSYSVTVMDAEGNSDTASATLVVQSPPQVQITPVLPSVCVGQTVSFTASGGVSYAWMGPNGFSANTATVVRSNATESMSGLYTVTVTGINGCTATSSVSVSVHPIPNVTVNSATIEPGGSVRLTATTPALNPSFRWSPGGEATASIIVSPVATTIYTVMVTDGVTGCIGSGSGRVSTFAGSLYFVAGPTGSDEPVRIGQPASFAVRAVGLAPVTYQWLRNGANIPGATQATFQLDAVAVTDGGRYTVWASDGIQRIESPPVSLIPDLPLLPSADDFAAVVGASSIHRINGPQGANRGSLTRATAETGEPAHAAIPALTSVWVGWALEQGGIVTLDTYGSGTDTRIAVYRWANRAFPVGLTNLDRVGANDDDNRNPGQPASQLQFNVNAGETYYIAVDSSDAAPGDFVFSWSLEVTPQRMATGLPTLASGNIRPGEGRTLGIVILLDPLAIRREIRWTRSGQVVVADAGGTVQIPAFGLDNVGRYQAEVRQFYPDGSFRTTLTDPVDLQLYQRSNDTDADLQATDRLLDLIRQVESRPRGPGAARTRARPMFLSAGVTGQQVFRTEGSSREIGEPLHGGEDTRSSEWYELITETDGIVTVDTAGSSFDTVVAVYHDDVGDRDPFNGLRQLGVNDDAQATVVTSRVEFCARGGDSYHVVVAGKGDATGLCFLNYGMRSFRPDQLCPPPAVNCPARVGLRNARAGTTVRIQGAARGRDPLRHRWYRNNTLVAETTQPELVLHNLTPADAGTYRLEAQNEQGVAFRDVVVLKVLMEERPALGYLQECDGEFQIILTGSASTRYLMEGSDDLVTWSTLWTGQPTTGTYEFLVTPELAFQNYRARVAP